MGKKCLINVEGGLGKNVMFTSILKEFKEQKGYDEVYVISPYYDVFKSCSAVTDAFPPGQGTLYQELVLDEDCDIYWKEPYSNQKFIKKQCHLFEAWAEELGFELYHPGNQYVPQLDRVAEEYPKVAEIANKKMDEWMHDFCIVQFNGGQSPLGDMKAEYHDQQQAIKRNYYKGEKIVELLREKYPNATMVHFALPNEPTLAGTVKVEVPYLTYRLLAKEAKAVVCIDSSLQHLSTGACNNVTVIWGETRPEHFGYVCNTNVCAMNVLNSQPYFKPLGISPSIVKMPEPEVVMETIMMEDHE